MMGTLMMFSKLGGIRRGAGIKNAGPGSVLASAKSELMQVHHAETFNLRKLEEEFGISPLTRICIVFQTGRVKFLATTAVEREKRSFPSAYMNYTKKFRDDVMVPGSALDWTEEQISSSREQSDAESSSEYGFD